MGLILFGLMIAVPILEIGVFIVVGRFIGLWPTLAGILLTAIIGSAIIRHQGLAIITKARQAIASGEAPVGEVGEGIALLIAGVLLLTPGFVTDSLGFILLMPAVRRSIAAIVLARAVRRADVRVHAGGSGAGGPGAGKYPGGGRPGAGVTIEGEWEDLSEAKPDKSAFGSDPSSGGDGPEPGRGWGATGARGDDKDQELSRPMQRAQV